MSARLSAIGLVFGFAVAQLAAACSGAPAPSPDGGTTTGTTTPGTSSSDASSSSRATSSSSSSGSFGGGRGSGGADAGSSSSSGGSIQADAGATPDGAAPPPPPASCNVTLPGGNPFGVCGGRGGGDFFGRSEAEPNDTTPESISVGDTICGTTGGADVDRFRFQAAAEDCFEIDYDATSAQIDVSGAGMAQSLVGSGTLQFQARQNGAIDVVVRGVTAQAYRFTVR